MHKVKKFNYWQFITNNVPGFITGVIVGIVLLIITIGNDVSMLKERTKNYDTAWKGQKNPNRLTIKNDLEIEILKRNIKSIDVDINEVIKSVNRIEDVLDIEHGIVISSTTRSYNKNDTIDYTSQFYGKRGETYREVGVLWDTQYIEWFGDYLDGKLESWVDLEMQEGVMTYKEYLCYLNNG